MQAALALSLGLIDLIPLSMARTNSIVADMPGGDWVIKDSRHVPHLFDGIARKNNYRSRNRQNEAKFTNVFSGSISDGLQGPIFGKRVAPLHICPELSHSSKLADLVRRERPSTSRRLARPRAGCCALSGRANAL
jgi:hypothetical protein